GRPCLRRDPTPRRGPVPRAPRRQSPERLGRHGRRHRPPGRPRPGPARRRRPPRGRDHARRPRRPRPAPRRPPLGQRQGDRDHDLPGLTPGPGRRGGTVRGWMPSRRAARAGLCPQPKGKRSMLGVRYLLPPEPITTIAAFLAAGGGQGLAAARRLGPSATIDEVAASGLRGRGGGGFPTGAKWASVRSAGGGRRYVAANGAEGEPATFKDRMLIRRDPYRVIEGTAIAALAVGATEVYVATKRSYAVEAAALRRAAVELGEAGLLGELTVAIAEGPD